MKKIMLAFVVLIGLTAVNAGNLWINMYGESFHDTKSNQYLADTYYSSMQLGVGTKYVNVYASYLQYGFYKLATDHVPYLGLGVKKSWVKDNLFVETNIDYHHDFIYDSNVFRVGIAFSNTLLEW